MSVLDRSALEQSPLADLHAIASELSIDGYRRLRKAALIDAILARQGDGAEVASPEPATAEAPALEDAVAEELTVRDEGRPSARRRRGRRGGRTRTATEDSGDEAARGEAARDDIDPEPEREAEPAADAREGQVAEGVVELLPNGSGFLRVKPPEPSDDDVYISAAQVKRCDLVSGDRISGPRRSPRRSERFASLVRIDTINDRPAAEVADSARFDELPAGFPTERFRLGSDDPTLKAIEWLTPFGRGSRVLIAGRPQSGKTEALRRLATAISGQADVQVLLALIGTRPEEAPEWNAEPAAAVSLTGSADAQAQALERVIDQGRRLAGRGAHTVVLVDTLDGVSPQVARKALAAARNIRDGGSLTVIATASAPLGGETTVVSLDVSLTGAGRFPALDLTQSWTMRADLLVGDAGAEAIVRARADALEGR
jgi:transcription termination factor Rho